MLLAATACQIQPPEPVAETADAQARTLLPPDSDTLAWRPLFNGRNLSGWKAKITGYEPGDNFGNTFRVEDGTYSETQYWKLRPGVVPEREGPAAPVRGPLGADF